jgi:hypothetical protein
MRKGGQRCLLSLLSLSPVAPLVYLLLQVFLPRRANRLGARRETTAEEKKKPQRQTEQRERTYAEPGGAPPGAPPIRKKETEKDFSN